MLSVLVCLDQYLERTKFYTYERVCTVFVRLQGLLLRSLRQGCSSKDGFIVRLIPEGRLGPGTFQLLNLRLRLFRASHAHQIGMMREF